MRYFVRENHGKYYLADPQWCKMYDLGAIFNAEPVAGFTKREDAEFFVARKNNSASSVDITKVALECRTDCQYATGFLNEQTCDFCVRKGNIRDYYYPVPQRTTEKGR